MKLLLLPLLFLFFLSHSQTEKDPQLVAHWSLDGDATDNSVYKAHGKIVGNPLTTDGIIDGKAFDFNGDDYIEITVNGKLSHLKKLSTGSVSMWFKVREWDINSTILPIFYYGRANACPDLIDGSNGGMIIEVGHGGIFPSENVFFTVYDKECAYPTMCFDSSEQVGIIEPGKWYHFVVVVGENYNTGFLNGEELTNRRYNFLDKSTSLFFDDFVSHEKLWIGKGFWRGEEVFFDGLIDDVRIYNKPLNLEEVEKIYKTKL